MNAPPRFLVTAGNTRERIDQVRDWGNIFTGNTGRAIARELATAGEVDLLTSNQNHLHELKDGAGLPHAIHASGFTSHAELKEALAALMGRQQYHAVFMTAAVADYRPVRVYQVLNRRSTAADGQESWTVRDVQSPKVKSGFASIAVLGEQTEKIVDLFRKQWGHTGLLIKFKLEVGIGHDELLRVAESSRLGSGADYLVANTLDMIEGPRAGAYLLSEAGARWIARPELAREMLRIAKTACVK